ncbi:hypothetical protein [Paenarthrobacter sp. C1]|uniref:hypothetical protein n=1 Tax=Paenarthrobacter sp. C1 TaxID=3400220 RepID=UPI003BF59714
MPGETKATVTWDAVPGAAGYAIYLDGSSSPEWTGTGLTADLTSLAVGPHSVTVTARAGETSPRSHPPRPSPSTATTT